MEREIVVSIKNVTKKYFLFKNDKEKILYFLGLKKYIKTKTVLNNISFELKKGEAVGIVGKNGAGKSTLLKIITGVISPTSGYVKVNGRIGALIELQAGLSKELTGRENIYLKCNILGIKNNEISDLMNKVIEFSELGEYIDQPVKTYSSGMKARLGFAINISIKPDILIVDEALSVGDKYFKEKCKNKINELINNGVTILLVSHSDKSLSEICLRGVVLNNAKLIYQGEISNCLNFYKELKQWDIIQKNLKKEEKYL